MNTFNNPMLPLSAFVVTVKVNGMGLDALTRAHSGFDSFAELIATNKAYRPSLACYHVLLKPSERQELLAIADAYDAAMLASGDARRAYRY